MRDALGSAGTQAAGLWEFNADGAMSKHLHPGKAAFNGVLSADLARAGFTGARRILEGDRGFFRATSESYDATRITDGLGAAMEDCGELLQAALLLRPHAHRHRRALSTCAPQSTAPSPRSRSRRYGRRACEIVNNMNPRTPYQAKFSIAYCVAAALLDGQCGISDSSAPRRMADPALSALLDRTRVTVAADLTAKYPAAWPARIAIVLDDGRVLRAAADYPRGNPENPVSTADLEDKFTGLVAPRFGEAAAQRALDAIRSLEDCPDIAGVFATYERHQSARLRVRGIPPGRFASCAARFNSQYWQKVEEQSAYPEEFVKALTEAGWLAALIPARIRRRRTGRHGSVGHPRGDQPLGREFRRMPRADVHHGHAAAARLRRSRSSGTCRGSRPANCACSRSP